MRILSVVFMTITLLTEICAQKPENVSGTMQDTINKEENILHSFDTIRIIENPYKFGDLTMTQQQYKVMPASFQDPSRIMIRYPGFSTANDGANSILFRGMPPEATRWQLFGADIVNPNHLSNASTANDLATGNAGGVNALSGSVLDYFHFEANPADISYANVLSGVSDMKMAPKINSFLDFNLIGLEAGLNFTKGKNAAGYLKNVYVAYRYSFVGILNQLGVDFGNEKIGYQDLSMYADLYRSYNKSLKIFSTLGSSSNMLSPVSPGDSITRYKDLQQVEYKSKLGIGGLQFVWNGLQSVFRSTLVSSFRTDTRSELTDALSQPHLRFLINRKNDREERMLSSHTAYQFTPEMEIDAELFFTFGMRMNLFSNSLIRDEKGETIQGFMFYPYYQMEGTIFGKWRYKTGIGVLYDNISEQWTAEPIFNLQYKINDKLSLTLDYRFSTMQNFTEVEKLNRRVNEYRIQSGNSQFSIEYRLKESLIRTSFFYHDIGDVSNYTLSNGPIGGHFSAFNGSNLGNDLFIFYPEMQFSGLANARSYGADVYYENKVKLRNNALHYMVNSSIFESSYSLPEEPDLYFDGKYNFRFSANASLAYLMNFSGVERKKNLIISLAGHYRGALREQPATEEAFGEPFNIYDFRSPFTNTFRPYQRIDFRIVYTRKESESRFLHRWSLDIQNVLNRENDGFRYYDPFLKQNLIQPQLGLVPVLSYRLEW
ncbi:MAG: hypothetical protein IPM42_19425 [Saprospiraceae bacterium]|nr:hypothetical protein [Saprospiraceae bacterium]